MIGLGVVVLVVAWLLPRIGLPPFSAHMIAHMLVVAVAAPLIALGVSGGRADPVRWWPGLGAIPASMIELVGVWAWHAPAWHHFARHTVVGWMLEQATFLGAGLLLWTAALGGGRRRRRERATQGVAGLLLTSMHMTLLGALLTLTPRALYGSHGGGWDPALDQQLGGAIMLLVGGLAYLVGGLWLIADVLAEPVPEVT